MNISHKKVLSVIVTGIIVMAAIGCSTVNKQVKVNAKLPRVSTKKGDYLGEGVVLGRFMWSDFYEAQFYPAKIITPASEATKGEYELESLAGSPDVAKGEKIWTKDVILKSHPAKKEDLKVGMVVLIAGGENPCDYDELKTARWGRAVVLSLDNMYKKEVEVRSGLYRRTGNVHLSCIRVIDEAPESVLEIPEE